MQSEALGFRAAAVGNTLACGISASGALSCWDGEFGEGRAQATPTRVLASLGAADPDGDIA